jgi:lipopolysaccharide transport system permease protein
MARRLWGHRGLVLELARREFSGRYKGSFGGVAWSFVQPLFLLGIYTVAFGFILGARWHSAQGTGNYALMVFAGLIVFNAFAECLAKAPTLVTGNPNFVKKVVFPLELLPWIMALNASAHALIGVLVWLAAYALLHGMPEATALLFPFMLLCLFPVLLGIGWLVGAMGVLVRDIGQLTGLVSHALLFLSPIFYDLGAVPPWLRPAIAANPLTLVIEELRAVLYFGELPHWIALAGYAAAATAFAALSLWVFRRLRPAFADML